MRWFQATLFAAVGGAIAAVAGLALADLLRREQISAGAGVYAEHCAACHGEHLEGQPNWQERLPSGRFPAPPHDASGHTWHHTDRILFQVTKEGLASIVAGYESDMPAFAGVLSDAEIESALAFIKSTWPERERGYQRALSKDDSP